METDIGRGDGEPGWKYAPVPLVKSRVPGGMLWGFYVDPLGFFTRLARTHGDIFRFGGLRGETYFLNHPDLIRDVLTTHDRRLSKGNSLRVVERLLGQGLLTSGGEFHRRQRRLVQPVFHKQRIAGYAEAMVSCARQAQEHWTDGGALDISKGMQQLTLAIAGRSLFGADMEAETREFTEAFTEILRLYVLAVLPFAKKLERFLPSLPRRFQRASGLLDSVIYRMIAERRQDCLGRDDLLSRLLQARDEDDAEIRMSDLEIRDEVITLLLAGYETTANALSWTWYLLAANPDVEAKLHAEVDQVMGDGTPTVEDLSRLPYTRMVIAESMRLYPPAWIMARRAEEDVPLGGHFIPAGASILFSQWVMHHDPRYYPEPDRFDPERWTAERQAGRPRFSYFPFGAGSRVCVGENFAWTELILVLAQVARQWRFRRVPGRRVVPQPLITLRPRGGIPMTAHRRSG